MDDKGSLDKATVISALQANGEADYDSVSRLFFAINKPMHFRTMVLQRIYLTLSTQARETLKNVNIDSSGRVELEDWVQLHSLLKAAKNQPLQVLTGVIIYTMTN